MPFLPIVARELRVAARRRVTYWVRTGAAVAVMLVGAWIFLITRTENRSPHDVAMVLFGILTGSAVLYSLVSGAAITADCLSQEKREGTLGLLFLTDLRGYDVVLGKLVASSINAFYGVIAVLPMLGVPLLLGGITPGEFGRMALVTVNGLFFALALGLCVSAMSRSAFKALVLTFVLLLFFTAGLPLCALALEYFGKARRVAEWLLLSSSGRTYFLGWDAIYKKQAREFWCSLVIVHGLSWVFLAFASVIGPRVWQDRPAGARRLRWRERWRLWSLGDLTQRRGFRRRLLERNGFFWLAARERLKPAFVWVFLGLIGCAWAWGLAKYNREWLEPAMYVVTGLVINFTLKIWFAAEAGRQLAEDRQNGALELLLSTPLTVREILRGQRLALQRQFLGPVLVALAAGCLFMMTPPLGTWSDEERNAWQLFWIGGMAMFLADLATFYWVGMWQALSSKNPNRAVIGTILRIMVLPLAGYTLVVLVRALVAVQARNEPGPAFFLSWWFALGLATDLLFATSARLKLFSQFRAAAAQRYLLHAGFWKRLFTGSRPGMEAGSPGLAQDSG